MNASYKSGFEFGTKVVDTFSGTGDRITSAVTSTGDAVASAWNSVAEFSDGMCQAFGFKFGCVKSLPQGDKK